VSGSRSIAAAAAAIAGAVLAAAAALSPALDSHHAGSRNASAHYRAHHDFASLQRALPELWLGRPRAEVEALLGPPTYCPVPDEQCYYASETRNRAGVILTLVVEYRIWRPDLAETTRSDRLEAISLGPVAE
jgi:hypothetical protein